MMSSSDAGTSFEAATTLKVLSPHTYEANFVDDWCIGSGKMGLSAIFLSLPLPKLGKTSQLRHHDLGY